ncbi:MAG: GumC family protein [Roseibium sp.]|uniref:GumC family protein n=1 Tax=Roseibium sp. TaxID=1936156 RepID=UPI002632A23C|nr:GumC family protein [Roseibium sp.]MCV0426934.1 GumC family protein [Roseibium sp.]
MNRFDDDWDEPDWGDNRRTRSSFDASRRRRDSDRDRGALHRELAKLANARKGGARKYDQRAQSTEDEPFGDEDRRGNSLQGNNRRFDDQTDQYDRESHQPASTYTVAARGPVTGPQVIESRYRAREPFLDTRSFIRSLYESRWIIVLLVIVGMALGAAATLTLTRKYTAHASLYFDPAKLQVTWDGQTSNQFSPQTVTSLVNSQIQILTSSTVMQDVVEKLSLTDDAEFGASLTGPASTFAAASALAKAVNASRVGDSFIIAVNVTTQEADKSAEIANEVVESFYQYETKTASDQYSNVTSVFDRRLEDLRAKAFAAEKAVEDYRAKNDLVTAGGVLISDERLAALNTALVAAQQKTIEASAKVDAANRLSLEDAVAGTSDTEVSSSTLVQLRQQYSTAAAELGSLQSQLGSRHPSISAAEATLTGLRTEIRLELKRMASIAQTELSRAQKAQDDLAKELAAQKALKLSNSPNQAALDNLLLQAETTRNVYEAMLTRTRQANEEFNNLQSNVQVIGKAVPPIDADGPGRLMMLIGGLFGGGALGLGLGICFALARRLAKHPGLRSYFSFND